MLAFLWWVQWRIATRTWNDHHGNTLQGRHKPMYLRPYSLLQTIRTVELQPDESRPTWKVGGLFRPTPRVAMRSPELKDPNSSVLEHRRDQCGLVSVRVVHRTP